MKKLVAVGALSVLLAGCADEASEEPGVTEEDTSTLEESEVNTPPEDNSEAEQEAAEGSSDSLDESADEDTAPAPPEDNELESYEEYSKIAEVADVSGQKAIVETDNPGTRVILFEEDNGKKTIKSVYVKKENRLKVISLDDDGLLFNDIIK